MVTQPNMWMAHEYGCTKSRPQPAISHCGHLLLTTLSGYKYKSLAKSTLLVVQKLHNFKKVYLGQVFLFSSIALIIPSHLIK